MGREQGLVQQTDQTGIQRMSMILVNQFVADTYSPNLFPCRIFTYFTSWFPALAALASDPHSMVFHPEPRAFARVNLPKSGTWGEYHQPILGYLSL